MHQDTPTHHDSLASGSDARRQPSGSVAGLLARADAYLHSAPLTGAVGEEIGPFTLFRSTTVWPYYARPRPGARGVTPADVRALADRCRALGLPPSIEWVVDVAPSVGAACAEAGWSVVEHPLLALEPDHFTPTPPPHGVTVRILPPDADALASAWATVMVGFRTPGTARGPDDGATRQAAVALVDAATVATLVDRAERSISITATAEGGEGPIGVGQHQPLGTTTEVVAVATLPKARRRGVAASVTTVLLEDAFEHGSDLAILSASDDAVARVYERVGFRRIGSAAEAAPT